MLRPNPAEAARRLADPPLLLVLPGSRSGELRRMAAIFGAAVGAVAKRAGPLEVVVPAVPGLAAAVRSAVAAWPVPARVVTDRAEKQAAFRQARAALTKSGTSTLELALAGIPMVAAYKVSLIEEAVARAMIKLSTVILANLVLGEDVVPEFLQRDATAEPAGRRFAAIAGRYARAPPPDRRLCPARRHHGARTGCPQRPRRRRGPGAMQGTLTQWRRKQWHRSTWQRKLHDLGLGGPKGAKNLGF